MSTVRDIVPDVKDWSIEPEATSDLLFSRSKPRSEWREYKLTSEQVSRFWKDGFLSNIPLLTAEQCDLILADYKYFTHPEHRHPGHDLLYEYHFNESGESDNALMHCLGHWRLTQLFHDLVFHPRAVVSTMAATYYCQKINIKLLAT